MIVLQHCRKLINTVALATAILLTTGPGVGAETRQFDDWLLVCGEAVGGPDNCLVLHEQTMQDEDGTSGRLIRVTITPLVGDQQGNYLLLALLPLGIHLPAGVAIKVDEQPQQHLTLQNCTQQGCQAAAMLEEEAAHQLRRGETALFGFKGDPRGETITIAVSLRGISAALDALP